MSMRVSRSCCAVGSGGNGGGGGDSVESHWIGARTFFPVLSPVQLTLLVCSLKSRLGLQVECRFRSDRGPL